jgi:MFS superfamily sulfate permease-like transporter
LRFVPPHLIVVVLGSAAAWWLALGSAYLVAIPENVFHVGFTWPRLSDFATTPGEYLKLAAEALLFWFIVCMVDVTESLATTRSIDKEDAEYHRTADLNRVLMANGLANFFSALFGGLTVIPGGVKSKTNQQAGGRTTNVNLFVAVLLLGCLLWGKSLMGMIPLTVLAAMLVYIGVKLMWKICVLWHVGWEQVALFVTTAIAAVITDLAIGVGIGMALKLCFHAYHHCWEHGESLWDLWRDPIEEHGLDGSVYRVCFSRPTVCFNTHHLNSALARVPHDADEVHLHFGDGVTLVDHTARTVLHEFQRHRQHHGVSVLTFGEDRLLGRSDHHLCALRAVPAEVVA